MRGGDPTQRNATIGPARRFTRVEPAVTGWLRPCRSTTAAATAPRASAGAACSTSSAEGQGRVRRPRNTASLSLPTIRDRHGLFGIDREDRQRAAVPRCGSGDHRWRCPDNDPNAKHASGMVTGIRPSWRSPVLHQWRRVAVAVRGQDPRSGTGHRIVVTPWLDQTTPYWYGYYYPAPMPTLPVGLERLLGLVGILSVKTWSQRDRNDPEQVTSVHGPRPPITAPDGGVPRLAWFTGVNSGTDQPRRPVTCMFLTEIELGQPVLAGRCRACRPWRI